MAADDIDGGPVTAEGSYDWWRLKVERLQADVRAAYAERDEMFERKAAALRERDEARRELAEAKAALQQAAADLRESDGVVHRVRALRDRWRQKYALDAANELSAAISGLDAPTPATPRASA